MNNKQAGERNQENNPISNRLKKKPNFLGINLTKKVKDLQKNYEMLKKLKKISEDVMTSHIYGSIFHN
jgi:hypothetical protein